MFHPAPPCFPLTYVPFELSLKLGHFRHPGEGSWQNISDPKNILTVDPVAHFRKLTLNFFSIFVVRCHSNIVFSSEAAGQWFKY